jgi:hypothetical protein
MTDGVNIFVAGQTGSGKSYLVKRSLAESRRLVVYLPKREDAGYPGVYFDGLAEERAPMLQWWEHAHDQCQAWRIVYRPRDKFDAEEFDSICRLVYLAGNCTFVAEEIAGYLSTRIFAAVGRYQGIKMLLTAGRTRGVTCWWITQRCFGIPREVTSEARDAYLFRLHEPADLDYVQERFGLEARLKLAQLQPFEHVHWINTGKVEVAKATGERNGTASGNQGG